jgi:hypothetical protein
MSLSWFRLSITIFTQNIGEKERKDDCLKEIQKLKKIIQEFEGKIRGEN